MPVAPVRVCSTPDARPSPLTERAPRRVRSSRGRRFRCGVRGGEVGVPGVGAVVEPAQGRGQVDGDRQQGEHGGEAEDGRGRGEAVGQRAADQGASHFRDWAAIDVVVITRPAIRSGTVAAMRAWKVTFSGVMKNTRLPKHSAAGQGRATSAAMPSVPATMSQDMVTTIWKPDTRRTILPAASAPSSPHAMTIDSEVPMTDADAPWCRSATTNMNARPASVQFDRAAQSSRKRRKESRRRNRSPSPRPAVRKSARPSSPPLGQVPEGRG